MRYVVMFFGLVGLAGSGVVGYFWMEQVFTNKDVVAKACPFVKLGMAPPEAVKEVAEFDRRTQAWPFLFVGAGFGVFGTFLAFERRRFSTSALFLCAALGPAVLQPLVLIFTFGLVLAGLLALLLKPRRPSTVLAEE